MVKISFRGVGCLLPLIFLLGAFSLSCWYSYTLGERKGLKTAESAIIREVIIPYVDEKIEKVKKDDWNDFIEALIWVESKGNCDTIGSKDDVGVLQIRKPIVDDCNRILGCDTYTYEDRYDSIKSVEMFNIIQDHYNPSHDKHYALKIWNSRAPVSYHRKVMQKFNEKNL